MSYENDHKTIQLYEAVGSQWLIDRADPEYTHALLQLLYSKLPAKGKILDICCGYGRILLPLLERGYDIQGIDISEVLIAKGREFALDSGLDATCLSVANMKTLPFADASFDFAFNIWASFNFLIEPQDQLLAANEMYRVLAPGGKVLIEIPAVEVSGPVRCIETADYDYLYRDFTAREMNYLLREAGFSECSERQTELAGRSRLIVEARKI